MADAKHEAGRKALSGQGGGLKTAPLVPLRDMVVFPGMTAPLFVGRSKSIEALGAATRSNQALLLATQYDAAQEDPGPDDICRVGVIGHVVQTLRLPDDNMKVLVEAQVRARITDYVGDRSFYTCAYELMEEQDVTGDKGVALVRGVRKAFRRYAKTRSSLPDEFPEIVARTEAVGELADLVASHLDISVREQQQLLETTDPVKRLEAVYVHLQTKLELHEVDKRIRGRVKNQMEKSQKEYYLNEQMRAIKKELGDATDPKGEIEELEQQLAAKKMPAEARERGEKEIQKLKMMSPASAEATVARNYIDWMLALPWESYKRQNKDIGLAERVLNEDHYGLDKPKERILEFLAVQSLVKVMKGPILCFVGPPGVGKTSLGKSIARATGRDFVRISLGGVRDEAEIRGHRRTYIGALPGKMLQGLKKAGSSNPVFLLDEVDKMSMDFRGDPSSALLEVLDPEQNHTFSDHYLDLDYDLSRVMFVCTANVLYQIPSPLQDRMEIIQLPGYIESEKLHIAREYLAPKQIKANGLGEDQIEFTDQGLLEVIRYHTRESGVRNLEREIATTCRKVARRVVERQSAGKAEKAEKSVGAGKRGARQAGKAAGKAGAAEKAEAKGPIRITPARIKEFLGIRKFRHGEAEEEDRVGLCTGLAYTEVGGELLQTEVAVTTGQGKLVVTGRLGEVMQESANAAMSYVRSRSRQLGLVPGFYSKVDIHIHVPEGATPKDGPSAGITIATAVASALTRVPVRASVAMTGEITLRGRVLPIGGLREKLIAAHRGGIDTVVIPKENEKELPEIPDHLKKGLRLVPVEHMDEVLQAAFALDDVSAFLSTGDHVVEAIFENSSKPGDDDDARPGVN